MEANDESITLLHDIRDLTLGWEKQKCPHSECLGDLRFEQQVEGIIEISCDECAVVYNPKETNWKDNWVRVGDWEGFSWVITNREIILYRALSRFYEVGSADDDTVAEAYAALAAASVDWRNDLTQHTWVTEEQRAKDNPHRIDWECPPGSDVMNPD